MSSAERRAAMAKAAEAAESREAQQRAVENSLRAKLKVATAERDKLLAQLGVIQRIEGNKPDRGPAWLSPKSPAKGHRATLCLLLTDFHLDEEVSPEELHGINAYNRDIALMRLERCVRGTIKLARHYMAGVKYDGITVFLGGDIFSGNIHEELARTNADTLFGSFRWWLSPVTSAIELLAREFGRVHVAGVPGNHGRMTRKPIMKQRAKDNLDWLFYSMLQRDLRRDDRITWTIPFAPSVHTKIYSTRFYMEHGDNFTGGSGISGALAPLMLGTHRTNKQQTAAGHGYDYMVLGHWHQHIFLAEQGLIVGSSLKGFDEFAQNKLKAVPAPPSQSLWIVTPEHGIGWSTRVFVQDRKAEGW